MRHATGLARWTKDLLPHGGRARGRKPGRSLQDAPERPRRFPPKSKSAAGFETGSAGFGFACLVGGRGGFSG